jgi:hypothetical protein
MTSEVDTRIDRLASVIFIFFVLFVAGCTKEPNQVAISPKAPAISPNVSSLPVEEQKADCVFADGGTIQGTVLFNNQKVEEGSSVTLIFDGGAFESVPITNGHYAAQLIVCLCGSEKTWIGFQLVSSEWRDYIVPQSSPLHVDINLTSAPTTNPNEPEVRLIFGMVTGNVSTQGIKAADGTLVEIKAGGGITQTVYVKNGEYKATTLGMQKNGESVEFLPITISTLDKSASLTPSTTTTIFDFQ